MKNLDTFETDKKICMHFEDDRERFEGAVVPPIFHNTLFTYETVDVLNDALQSEHSFYVYGRGTNPTVEIVEKKLAALERGQACKLFSSGMAAISAALINSVKSGDHVLCVSNLYFSTMELLKYLGKFNVSHSVIYSTETEAIKQALQPNTKVIFLESPTDMTFRLINLDEVADLARTKGIRTIIDNTWATPLFQKPLTKGIDVVVHSASKYLGGHSDVLGGAIVTSKENMKTIFRKEYLLMGAAMTPNEASLLLRGLRTLPFRIQGHEENAIKVAKFLHNHPKVKQVNFPGLETHPDYHLGKSQLSGYSGLMSFELNEASFNDVKGVINKMKVFKIGVSWGSFESLIISPSLGNNEGKLVKEHIDPCTIRLAVGLENANALIEDLEQALSE
ncbi:cystathionine beta-lyase/cystathionine gamma-synthase [Neobacillus niacini]|uniref:trans-sulfuration enzyme family protein n=1 Tax=Neobacillus niacini TaxID=86668 RepID=UPI00278458EB|nr:aminotransferase class I/II-fold pyridoxal phosphate-dependent enzyme [Neobacillus niacini]MDQ1003260.1 cystathionine beta-lyase/cystathionine gamma-synthase [Neobacillus niacini]